MSNTFPNTRVPFMSLMFDNSMAVGSSPKWRTLIIGSKSDDGKAIEKTPYLIVGAKNALEQFGKDSDLYKQFKVYKDNDTSAETWGISIPVTKASVDITPVLSLAEGTKCSGDLSIYVDGSLIKLALKDVSNINDFCQQITDEVNKNKNLFFIAKNMSTKVIFESKNSGASYNNKKVSFNDNKEIFPAGITDVKIGSAAVKSVLKASKNLLEEQKNIFSGGSNPNIDDVFTAIRDMRFNTFVCPYSDKDSIDKMAKNLQSRWEPKNQNDGVAFFGNSMPIDEAVKFSSNFNSQCVTIIDTSCANEETLVVNAAVAAQCSASALQDPAKPLSTILLAGITSVDEHLQPTFDDRDTLLNSGISTLVTIGSSVHIERVITTYKENDAGVSDESYLNLETIFTLSFIRQYFYNRFWGKFNRAKLADDNAIIPPGQTIITPRSAKAELISIYKELQNLGYVYDSDTFIKNLVVERDKQVRTKLNMLLPPTVMSQLFNVNTTIQFRR